jgi:cysteine desulfurase
MGFDVRQSQTASRAAAIVLVFVAVSVVGYAIHDRRSGTIYMDHNGTTPILPASLREYVRASKTCYGNPSTACASGQYAKRVLEDARASIAHGLGCKQTDLVFTSGATESNVIAIRGFVARAAHLGRQCIVVTTPIEHSSVENTVASIAQDGVTVVRMAVDKYGMVDLGHLRGMLASLPPGAAVMVAVIWINNEIGTIQDVIGLIDTCRSERPQTHIHLDATQVIGRYRVALDGLGASTVSFSAHKFRGPHGVGGLYVSSHASDNLETVMTGGKQEKGLRGGTENVAACAAMSVALADAHRHLDRKADVRVAQMRAHLIGGLLSSIPGLIVNHHPDRCAFNTISVCLPCDSRELVQHLSDAHSVCLAVGSACAQGGVSSTLAALGVAEPALRGSLRISLGFSNTLVECEKVLRSIVDFLNTHRCDAGA